MLSASLLRTVGLRTSRPSFPACRSPSFRAVNTFSTRPTWATGSARRTHLSLTVQPGMSPSRGFSAFARLSRPTISRVLPRNIFRLASTTAPTLPTVSPPAVARWLLLSSGLVFAVIVVGGVTRLTESGLSITEWKPITGILPPLSEAEWMEEFEKYKATPEFKLLNHSFTLSEFKRIFYMEWGHRVLGRVIGLSFVLPLAYFASRRMLSSGLPLRLFGLASLIGVQGAIGWYMVKSGLEDSLMETPGAVPRVSQYRLAMHLGTAFVLYGGMFYTGLAVMKDWAFAKGKVPDITPLLRHAVNKKLKTRATLLAGLVFLTALSGAFVAGLDAGLLYNEFPLMGGQLVPPSYELFSDAYAKSDTDKWWRNIFENPTTVQFDHRVLAVTTYLSTAALWATTMLSPRARSVLPRSTKRMLHAAFAMVNVQAALGISTLLYLVPVPLAAAHQAGSVALLTAVMHLLVTLRNPSKAALAWRTALLKAGANPSVAAASAGAGVREAVKAAVKQAAHPKAKMTAVPTKSAAPIMPVTASKQAAAVKIPPAKPIVAKTTATKLTSTSTTKGAPVKATSARPSTAGVGQVKAVQKAKP